MKNKEDNGVCIIPMNDFWVDCYTTAIFSAMLSFGDVDKRTIYRNSYEYVFDRNKKNMGRVYIKTYINDYIDGFLVQNEKHDFSKDENVIDSLKECLNQRKLIMLGIDMFYGVHQTSQWHRYHIRHNIIVEKYDDNKKEMLVLETTNEGYREYRLSYDEITQAVKGFQGESDIYSIEYGFCPNIYSIKEVKKYSEKICHSIDEILFHIKDIWHVEDVYLMTMKDEIEVHLRSMANRQKVNYLLFQSIDSNQNYGQLIREFIQLEGKYLELRELIIDLCISKKYTEREDDVRKIFSNLLRTEKEVWRKFISND